MIYIVGSYVIGGYMWIRLCMHEELGTQMISAGIPNEIEVYDEIVLIGRFEVLGYRDYNRGWLVSGNGLELDISVIEFKDVCCDIPLDFSPVIMSGNHKLVNLNIAPHREGNNGYENRYVRS